MRANPGGQLALSEVIGRDALVRHLWRVLERQSLVLSAERRIGKTSVIKKMQAEGEANKLCSYHDLEAVRTPLEFVQIVFNDVEGYLSRSQRTATHARRWLAHLTGLEIGGVVKFPETVAAHWKTLLVKTIEDLVEQKDNHIIFFWDEIPLMLYNIKTREGEESAREVLDTLRALRQTHPGLRMVFTGSIGLHNVITSLKRGGYANDPTNDMNTVNVPPLAFEDARNLARQLLEGEGIPTNNLQDAADAIAVAVDNIPFFIHHIIDQIAQHGDGVASPTAVEEIVKECLTDARDPWHLRYYRERIDVYYAPDERLLALNLLDVLSTAKASLHFADLFNLLKAKIQTEEREKTRDVLTLLQRDHYVRQELDGSFHFQFPLIQRFWRLHRGLS